MSFLIDIVHMVLAATLAMLGFGYERENDCPPVRFQPAAQVGIIAYESTTQSPHAREADSAAQPFVTVNDCETIAVRSVYPPL